jgi:hypothetical protein
MKIGEHCLYPVHESLMKGIGSKPMPEEKAKTHLRPLRRRFRGCFSVPLADLAVLQSALRFFHCALCLFAVQ